MCNEGATDVIRSTPQQLQAMQLSLLSKGATELAKAVLATADAREKSFDQGAADAAEAADESCRRKVEDEGGIYFSAVDYDKFYLLSVEEAALGVAGPFAGPVLLMLSHNWNEAIGWAQRTLKDERGTELSAQVPQTKLADGFDWTSPTV